MANKPSGWVTKFGDHLHTTELTNRYHHVSTDLASKHAEFDKVAHHTSEQVKAIKSAAQGVRLAIAMAARENRFENVVNSTEDLNAFIGEEYAEATRINTEFLDRTGKELDSTKRELAALQEDFDKLKTTADRDAKSATANRNAAYELEQAEQALEKLRQDYRELNKKYGNEAASAKSDIETMKLRVKYSDQGREDAYGELKTFQRNSEDQIQDAESAKTRAERRAQEAEEDRQQANDRRKKAIEEADEADKAKKVAIQAKEDAVRQQKNEKEASDKTIAVRDARITELEGKLASMLAEKEAAENAQKAAEKATAEKQKSLNEANTARKNAETAQANAEKAKTAAESERDNALSAKQSAEQARDEADIARQDVIKSISDTRNQVEKEHKAKTTKLDEQINSLTKKNEMLEEDATTAWDTVSEYMDLLDRRNRVAVDQTLAAGDESLGMADGVFGHHAGPMEGGGSEEPGEDSDELYERG